MNEEKNNSFGNFVTGAIFGAVVTFLFATKTGRKIKDELLEEGSRLIDALSEEIEDAPKEIKETGKEIKKELAEKAGQMEDLKEAVEDSAHEVLREVPQQVENIQKKGRHFFFSKKSSSKNES